MDQKTKYLFSRVRWKVKTKNSHAEITRIQMNKILIEIWTPGNEDTWTYQVGEVVKRSPPEEKTLKEREDGIDMT